jgi:hypothetical protein
MCRDRRCSSTALQRVRGTRRRTLVLVAQLLFSQMPKFSFSTFGPAGLLPKLIRARVDFPFAGFSQYVFSGLEHGPGVLRTYRWTCQASFETGLSIQVHIKPLVPPQDGTRQLPHKTKAKRALHRMAFAGTVPLLARIPFPVTEPRAVPAGAGAVIILTLEISRAEIVEQPRYLAADAYLPRTASAALTMLMVGFFPQ